MINILKIKCSLGFYRSNIEYWIPIGDITISQEFQLSKPNFRKVCRKDKIFKKTGKMSKIMLNKDFVLTDGYISYLLYKSYEMDKVPVYFED